MGTIVSLHAHPDDESIHVGGLLAKASDAGHRLVLVFATRGELGTPVEGVLSDGEQLSIRRTAECYESARVLGVDRVDFLGYTDSGMMGEATNDDPWTFWQADVEHAASRLAAVLREEQADLVTTYDAHGGYGHPDHIQVHRVGRRAAELAGVAAVAQATSNREATMAMIAQATEMGLMGEADGAAPSLPDDFGTPAKDLTHHIDVSAVVERKRASMLAHASQIGPDHFMATIPDEAFAQAFGTEWFIVDVLNGPTTGPAVLNDLFTPGSIRP